MWQLVIMFTKHLKNSLQALSVSNKPPTAILTNVNLTVHYMSTYSEHEICKLKEKWNFSGYHQFKSILML